MSVDRSFANPPPRCIGDYGAPLVDGGRAWLELAADAVKAATDRQICLNEVAAWIATETIADGQGAGDE